MIASAFAVASAGLGPAAGAAVIDFENVPVGSNPVNAIPGVTITVDNPNAGSPDQAVIIDSNVYNGITGVQGPWQRGNRQTATPGNLLAIRGGGPDDPNNLHYLERAKPSGTVLFAFDTPITQFGLSYIDLDGPAEFDPAGGNIALRFFRGGVQIANVTFPDLLLTNPDAEVGNKSNNAFDPITVFDITSASVDADAVAVTIGGSGAIDDIVFTPVPEPGTIALAAAGGLLMLGRRRRRDAVVAL
jgi:hypothetical protein